MSDRQKPHKGRDLRGRYRVRQADTEEMLEDPEGVDYLRDDVRLGGAVADTGMYAGASGERVSRLIEDNREDVERLVHPDGEASVRRPQGPRQRRKR